MTYVSKEESKSEGRFPLLARHAMENRESGKVVRPQKLWRNTVKVDCISTIHTSFTSELSVSTRLCRSPHSGMCESEHQCAGLIFPLCFTITQTPALQNALVQKMAFKCALTSLVQRVCLLTCKKKYLEIKYSLI